MYSGGPLHIGEVIEPLAIAATGLLAFSIRKNKRDLWFSLGALFAQHQAHSLARLVDSRRGVAGLA